MYNFNASKPFKRFKRFCYAYMTETDLIVFTESGSGIL